MTVGAGLFLSPSEKDPIKQNAAIRQLMEGRSNAVGSFTITSNTTSTLVTAVNCYLSSVVLLSPYTSTAANDFGLISVVPGNGTFTANHASNTLSTRTFLYAVVG